MVAESKLSTIEEQIKALPSDARHELVNGKVVIAQPMTAIGSMFIAVLAYHLNAFCFPRRLGFAMIEGLFQLRENDLERRPDLAFIPAAKWPANLTRDNDPHSMNLVPTLTVEVVGANNTITQIERKTLEYFEAGVLVVWEAYPILRKIHVYSSPDDCRVISQHGTLEGGEAIPGFQVKVAEIFDCIFPPQTISMNDSP